MRLKQNRYGHIVNNRLHLAGNEVGSAELNAYVDEVRQVYGTLYGVVFTMIKANTNLTAHQHGGSFEVPWGGDRYDLKLENIRKFAK